MTIRRAWGAQRSRRDPPRGPWLGPWLAAVVMLVAGVLMVLTQSVTRPMEARLSAALIGFTEVARSRSIGNVVILPLDGDLVGMEIGPGCSTALLVTPFFLLGAGLVLSRRTSVQRGLTTLGALVLSLFVLNLLRLLVIAVSMRLWGLEQGFEVSHVVLGTVLSTLGVVAGLILYIRTALHSRAPAVVRG